MEEKKFLDKEGLIKAFSLIKEDVYTKSEIIDIVNSIFPDGQDGQVLTKTDNGVMWEDYIKFWKGSLEEFNKLPKQEDDRIYFIVGELSTEEDNINPGQ